MAARLNRVRCDIITADGPLEGVSLQIPTGTYAVIRREREVLSQTEGVTAVSNVGAGKWEVGFADGTLWFVQDAAQPCGCG